MNGAAEIILEELLKEAKKTNKALADMLKANAKVSSSSSSGGSDSSSAVSGLANLAGTLNPLNLLLKGISGTFNLLGGILGKMFEAVGKVVGGLLQTGANLFDFAQKAALSGAKLSEFYDAFRNLPFYLGEVMGIFAKIIAFSEGLLRSYQDLTKVGAAFSGNLFTMLKAATSAGMTLTEFQGVVKNNSDIFSTMGGNVNDGIMKFSEYSKNLMGPGSKYAKQLLALGYTSEEAGEALAGYIRSQGTMNKEGLADADSVSASVVAYANQLDSLSKMTGKQRDLIEKGVKDAEKEATLQTFLAGLSKENADTARAALADAFAKGGPAYRDQIALGMQGVFGPVTKEMGDLAAGTGGQSVIAARRVYEIMNSNMTSAQKLAAITQEGTNTVQAAVGIAKGMGTQNAALMAATNNGMLQSTAILRQTGLSITNAGAALAKAEQQRAEQLKGNAGALAQAEQNIKLFGTTIMGIIGSALAPLAGPLIDFGMQVTSVITTLVGSKGFRDAVASITNWFTTTFTELKKSESMTEFFQTFFKRMVDGAEKIWKAFEPIWTGTVKPALLKLWDDVKPTLIEGFKSILEFIKPYFNSMLRQLTEGMEDYIFKATKGVAFGGKEYSDRRGKDEFLQTDKVQEYIKSQILGAKIAGDSKTQEKFENVKDNRDYIIDAYMARRRAEEATPPAVPKVTKSRDFGTSGMLGKTVEPENTTVNIEKDERVLNPAETAGYNNQAQAFDQLNNLTKQLLDAMRENNDLTRRGVDATKGLSGNLFA
jgi:hypothetical protein